MAKIHALSKEWPRGAACGRYALARDLLPVRLFVDDLQRGQRRDLCPLCRETRAVRDSLSRRHETRIKKRSLYGGDCD
jgi:hypothetical protein